VVLLVDKIVISTSRLCFKTAYLSSKSKRFDRASCSNKAQALGHAQSGSIL
jgi:hypothetical protein